MIFSLLPLVDYHVVESNKEKAIIPNSTNRSDQRAHQAFSFRQKNHTETQMCFPHCLPIATSTFRPGIMFLTVYLLTGSCLLSVSASKIMYAILEV